MRLPYNAASIVFRAEMTTTTKESQRMTKHNTDVFTLGHSPDPDDAFMFYAMAQNKIDLRGYRFEHRLEDIQTLNERALRGELHISAISIHAYAHAARKYALLPCGASMGDGYGPIVIRKRTTPNVQRSTSNADSLVDSAVREFLKGKKVAVPGKMTSAFLVLQLFLGEFDYVVVPFDQIFDAVRTGRADVGLIIHEGQLTYGKSGFEKIVDLGKWWKEQTGFPLPLGGNVVRKDIPPAIFAKASTMVWRIGTRRCGIRFPMRATWTRSSPGNSSACM